MGERSLVDEREGERLDLMNVKWEGNLNKRSLEHTCCVPVTLSEGEKNGLKNKAVSDDEGDKYCCYY